MSNRTDRAFYLHAPSPPHSGLATWSSRRSPTRFQKFYAPLIALEWQWDLYQLRKRFLGEWTGRSPSHEARVVVKNLDYEHCEMSIELDGSPLWEGRMAAGARFATGGAAPSSAVVKREDKLVSDRSLTMDWSGPHVLRFSWATKLRSFASLEGWTFEAPSAPLFISDLELTRRK